MKKQEEKKSQWTFIDVWNASLIIPDTKHEPRDRIYASELGGSMIDRYLKMTGVQQTNPPNERSLRKFQAGNLWEWVIGFILKRAGILQQRQSRITHQYDNMLEVSGKLDFIAGGKPDWDIAKNEVEVLDLPERLFDMCVSIITQLQNTWSEALPEIILELKSQGSFVYEKTEKTGKANPNHELQIFHYLKALKMPEGHIVYVCREDCRMTETFVYNPSEIELLYKQDIETITGYYNAKQMPPKEKHILFDERVGTFSKNWKVEYSPYLTKIYGFENAFSFFNTYAGKVSQWNRVLKRCVEGAKMTAANLEIIADAKLIYPKWDEAVDIAKALKEQGIEVGEEVAMD